MMIGYSWVTAAIFPSDSIQNSEHVKKVVSNKVSTTTGNSSTAGGHHGDDDEDKPDPPRNFTLEQLSQYDGTKDEKNNEDKPVYLSMNGIVFDVTQGRNFYGPGGPYEKVSFNALFTITVISMFHTFYHFTNFVDLEYV